MINRGLLAATCVLCLAAPAPALQATGPTAEPVPMERLALVSDLNGRYGSTDYSQRVTGAAEAIIALTPDLVVGAGDMVAGQAPRGLDDATRTAMWKGFHDAFVAPLTTAGIPLAITVGNHDGSAFPGFEADRDAFEAYWLEQGEPPGLLAGSQWPWRYALERDGLLLIAFDGTLPGKVAGAEQEFVARMLAEHGAEADWTVVFSHLPFWPLAQRRESEIIDDPGFLELLHGAGVDCYASGHHHLYYAGVDSDGMLHLSVGALGGNARGFAGGGARQPHSFAVLERDGSALRVHAMAAPGFTGEVPEAGLPARVSGPAGELRRVEGPVPLRD